MVNHITPLGELAFLPDEFRGGLTLFRRARSINRLRRAIQSFVTPFGDISAARHAARFNVLGKGYWSKNNDLSFAIKVIRSYEGAQLAAIKASTRVTKKMAHKISQGSVTGSSRRRAGSWITQSDETAILGVSECKAFC